MGLVSATNKTLSPAVTSKNFDVSEISIRYKGDDPDFAPDVSITLRAFDADGKVLKKWPMNTGLADLIEKYPVEIAAIHDAITPFVYKIAQDRGEFPTGTVS